MPSERRGSNARTRWRSWECDFFIMMPGFLYVCDILRKSDGGTLVFLIIVNIWFQGSRLICDIFIQMGSPDRSATPALDGRYA